MVKVAIPAVVYSMPTMDIISGLILTKRKPYFKEEALTYALREAAQQDRKLREKLLEYHCDGNPDHVSELENALNQLLRGGFIAIDNEKGTYMTASGRQFKREELKKEYGREILKQLRPLAEAVWQKAREYHN